MEANDAFLRMVGYEREDLVSGRLRWTDLTPPEWRAADATRLGGGEVDRKPAAVREGVFPQRWQPRARCWSAWRPSRKPANQGVAFVVDLTERKRAEAQARESEIGYGKSMQLEHANRVATMGQLSASIAHEVNQPIAAAVTNADTALRWLDRQPPNLEKARPVDRPHHQRWQAGRRYGEPDPRFLQEGAGARRKTWR